MDITFPSRRLTAALLLAAAALMTVGLAVTPWEPDHSVTAYHDTLAAHADRSQVAAIVLYAGYVLLVPAAFGLVAGAGGRGGWATRIGAVVSVVGLVGLPGLIITDAFDLALAQHLDRETSVRISENAASSALAIVMTAPAGVGLMLGTTLLVAGLWRARVVPVAAPALVLLGWVVPMIGFSVEFIVAGALLFLAGCAIVATRLAHPAPEPAEMPAATAAAAAAPAGA
jgi:hypothetical protein